MYFYRVVSSIIIPREITFQMEMIRVQLPFGFNWGAATGNGETIDMLKTKQN